MEATASLGRVRKQAAQNPDEAAQHDRVIPLGPWNRRARNPAKATHKDLVQTLWERTEAVVAEEEPEIRIPPGRTHTLRPRVRHRPPQ